MKIQSSFSSLPFIVLVLLQTGCASYLRPPDRDPHEVPPNAYGGEIMFKKSPTTEEDELRKARKERERQRVTDEWLKANGFNVKTNEPSTK